MVKLRFTNIFYCGIFVLLTFCSLPSVRAEEWDELELDEDISEARLLFSTNSTSSVIPDSYVSDK